MIYRKIALMVVLLTASASPTSAQSGGSPDAKNPAPITVAVVVDFTGSMAEWGIHLPDRDDILPIIEAINEFGGELAVLPVREDYSEPLLRLRLPPPAPELKQPDTNTDVFTRQNRMKEYRKLLPEYERREKQRRAENRIKIDLFLPELDSLLATPPDRPSTELWNAIRRATLFLSENPLYWVTTSGQEPSKHLLLVTDGRHTASSTPAKIDKDISIAVVSGAAGLGDLEKLGRNRVVWFESVPSAVSYTIILASRGANK